MIRKPVLLSLLASLVVVAAVLAGTSITTRASGEPGKSPAGHVFVINLENKGFDETWGSSSKAPYLSQTLRSQGVLLTQYHGIGHFSLGNYIAQISGQGPNPDTQSDCQTYTSFTQTGTASPGQAVGRGCVYPEPVPTLPGQLTAAGKTWKGYMEDMGTPCRHPALNTPDDTQKAKAGDQYAARHNPFVYFASITGSPACANQVADLKNLPADLSNANTTPNLTYITPNLCNDGHDAPCVDGQPGGLESADAWLRNWVPVITGSPAFKQDGMLIVTFDEAEPPDATACCGEGPGPNAPLPGITGPGGGRTGTLVLSPQTKPNTTSATPYNHYSLLASIEDIFGLPYLGYAASPGLARFGKDVFQP